MRHLFLCLVPFLLAACVAAQTDPASEGEASAASRAEGSGALALLPVLDREAGRADNFVYSPASIDQAFGLLRLGASGATAEQLDQLMPAPADAASLESDGQDVEVRLANALFLSRDWAFRETYVREAKRRYQATAEELDFAEPDSAARQINAWANQTTDGLIQQVIAPSAIDPETAAVLANALFFDGKWTRKLVQRSTMPFLHGDGRDEPFVFNGDMREERLVEHDGWYALRLPYANDRYAADIIIPEQREVMTAAPSLGVISTLGDRLSDAEPRLVELMIPQFEVDYSTGLVAPLQEIGLTLPFSKSEADFGALIAPNQRQVYVSDAVHLSKLQVFDEGTRAAAVTTLTIVPTAARILPEDPVRFVADRPFLFVIRDLQTGTILFIGRIADPQPFEPDVQEP